MGLAMVAGRTTHQGPWAGMHRGGRLERRAPRGMPHDLGICRLPRFGQCSVAASHIQRLGGWPPEDPLGPGKTSELGLDDLLAPPLATPGLASGHRLASGTVLRGTRTQSQRNLLWQVEAGHNAISRLCLGLHCSVWAALYAGAPLGPPSRIDRRGLATFAGTRPRTRPQNQAFAAGPRFLQRSGDRIFARGTTPVSDAGHVSRTPTQEKTRPHRSALDQTSESGVVSTHVEEPQAPGDHLRLCGLSHTPQSQRWQTRAAEAAFRCLASAWLSRRDPRTLPAAIRYRVELPPATPSADLHLYAQPPLTLGIRGLSLDPAQFMGVAPRDDSGGWIRRPTDHSPRPIALQTHARLDCSDCRIRTS